MATTTTLRIARKLAGGGVMMLATSAAVIGLGAAPAGAEELRSDSKVNSRQAHEGIGVVRGDSTWGDVRGAEILEVHAHGEVRESTKAVPSRPRGTRADGFRGSWRPGMRGSW